MLAPGLIGISCSLFFESINRYNELLKLKESTKIYCYPKDMTSLITSNENTKLIIKFDIKPNMLPIGNITLSKIVYIHDTEEIYDKCTNVLKTKRRVSIPKTQLLASKFLFPNTYNIDDLIKFEISHYVINNLKLNKTITHNNSQQTLREYEHIIQKYIPKFESDAIYNMFDQLELKTNLIDNGYDYNYFYVLVDKKNNNTVEIKYLTLSQNDVIDKKFENESIIIFLMSTVSIATFTLGLMCLQK